MLVAIEGIDGSGKRTQAERLIERAEDEGLRVDSFSFPQYGHNPFGNAIADFLNGRFGELQQVHPRLAALLFAGDRFAARDALRRSNAAHDLVVCDRYMASNLAHQASKLDEADRREFIDWLQEIEIEIYRLPPADLTIFLDVPPETARALVLDKDARSYTEEAMDIQEADAVYLERTRSVYAQLVEQDRTTRWVRVACGRSGGAHGGDAPSEATLRDVEEIAEEAWRIVHDELANRSTAPG